MATNVAAFGQFIQSALSHHADAKKLELMKNWTHEVDENGASTQVALTPDLMWKAMRKETDGKHKLPESHQSIKCFSDLKDKHIGDVYKAWYGIINDASNTTKARSIKLAVYHMMQAPLPPAPVAATVAPNKRKAKKTTPTGGEVDNDDNEAQRAPNTNSHEMARLIHIMADPQHGQTLTEAFQPMTRRVLDATQHGTDDDRKNLAFNALAIAFNSTQEHEYTNEAVEYTIDPATGAPMFTGKPAKDNEAEGYKYGYISEYVGDINPGDASLRYTRDGKWVKAKINEIRTFCHAHVKHFSDSGTQKADNLVEAWSLWCKGNGGAAWTHYLILTIQKLGFIQQSEHYRETPGGLDTGEVGEAETVTPAVHSQSADKKRKGTTPQERESNAARQRKSRAKRRRRSSSTGGADSDDSESEEEEAQTLSSELMSFMKASSEDPEKAERHRKAQLKIAAASACLNSQNASLREKAEGILESMLDDDA